MPVNNSFKCKRLNPPMEILRVAKCTNKTHLYAAYKRLTSQMYELGKSERRGMKKAVPCKQKTKRKAKAAIPTSDKIDFKTKLQKL